MPEEKQRDSIEIDPASDLGNHLLSLSHGKGTEGVKDDGTKAMWHLLPWKAVAGLVDVLTFGARKYAANGWRTVPNGRERYTSALLRHLHAMQMGEKVDKESGLKHVDHLLTNAAFLAELED